MNMLSWSLSLGIDGNMGQVQVWEKSFDLMEAIIKVVHKKATELC